MIITSIIHVQVHVRVSKMNRVQTTAHAIMIVAMCELIQCLFAQTFSFKLMHNKLTCTWILS